MNVNSAGPLGGLFSLLTAIIAKEDFAKAPDFQALLNAAENAVELGADEGIVSTVKAFEGEKFDLAAAERLQEQIAQFPTI